MFLGSSNTRKESGAVCFNRLLTFSFGERFISLDKEISILCLI